jgi:hypothetical protein
MDAYCGRDRKSEVLFSVFSNFGMLVDCYLEYYLIY